MARDTYEKVHVEHAVMEEWLGWFVVKVGTICCNSLEEYLYSAQWNHAMHWATCVQKWKQNVRLNADVISLVTACFVFIYLYCLYHTFLEPGPRTSVHEGPVFSSGACCGPWGTAEWCKVTVDIKPTEHRGLLFSILQLVHTPASAQLLW